LEEHFDYQINPSPRSFTNTVLPTVSPLLPLFYLPSF